MKKLLFLVAISTTAIALSGCQSTRENAGAPSPTATYNGPTYLRGTVGSMTSLRNAEPLLVSGYGLVVNLHDTGSSDVPSFLRKALINRMQKRGLGSVQLGTQNLTPQRVLADKNTAVVAVRGLIPPGATKGTHFDVVVTTLSGTQTTSLAYGKLWTTDLTIDGTDPSLPYMPTQAIAHGQIYTKPFKEDANSDASDGAANSDFQYNAVILSGGKVTKTRKLVLALNHPSWLISRHIADSINERFPMPPGSMVQTAEAVNDLLIKLNIPPQYKDNPGRIVSLIKNLFVQRNGNFTQIKAKALLSSLKDHPKRARDVMLSCIGFGNSIVPLLRNYYTDKNMTTRLVALRAGASLKDERTSRYLYELAQSGNISLRIQAAEALVHLPRSLKGTTALRLLLNDSSKRVRLAAYNSLEQIGDPIIEQLPIKNKLGQTKYLVERVPSDKPLIYVTQKDVPTIVIFKPNLGFNPPMIQSLWHHTLMLRQDKKDKPLQLFYQWPQNKLPTDISNKKKKELLNGKTYKLQPTVATLAYMLGHVPTAINPEDGLGLSYSQVVDVLYQLSKRNAIDAPIDVHISALAKFITGSQNNVKGRPITPEAGGPVPVIGGKYHIPVGSQSTAPNGKGN